jgi:transcription factor TGA
MTVVFIKMQVMLKHVEPSSEGQLLGIYNLQQWVQETEGSLSLGMETLQHSLSDTVASPELAGGNFMGHMNLALNKISAMEGIVRQVMYIHDHIICDVYIQASGPVKKDLK